MNAVLCPMNFHNDNKCVEISFTIACGNSIETGRTIDFPFYKNRFCRLL